MDLKQCSDEELIVRYRDGDTDAMDFIFERYKHLVRKKAKAMFLAGGDNDDLIQEGMIGLYKAIRDYNTDREASFATFASMCINRQMITAVAASNRKKNMPLNTYVSYDMPAGGDEGSDMRLVDILQSQTELNPEKLLIDKEHNWDLKSRLKEVLSTFEQQVLTYYLEGMDYTAIAKKMQKPPKSVDNALQRIRSKAARLTLEN
jgi:RNA polymerase, sigma 30 subunit, SigH